MKKFPQHDIPNELWTDDKNFDSHLRSDHPTRHRKTFSCFVVTPIEESVDTSRTRALFFDSIV
jgi:hypothetical protein